MTDKNIPRRSKYLERTRATKPKFYKEAAPVLITSFAVPHRYFARGSYVSKEKKTQVVVFF